MVVYRFASLNLISLIWTIFSFPSRRRKNSISFISICGFAVSLIRFTARRWNSGVYAKKTLENAPFPMCYTILYRSTGISGNSRLVLPSSKASFDYYIMKLIKEMEIQQI